MLSEDDLKEMRMEPGALYREEVFTDRRVGAIRRLTPVKADGSADPARAVLYLGQAQLYTPAGALPLSFEIEADSLEEAVRKFAGAAQESVEQTLREARGAAPRSGLLDRYSPRRDRRIGWCGARRYGRARGWQDPAALIWGILSCPAPPGTGRPAGPRRARSKPLEPALVDVKGLVGEDAA